MRIGILQTAYKKSSEYGAYYNVQELGLARALAERGHEVILYKGVDGEDRTTKECDGRLTINLIGVKYIGINGLIQTDRLNVDLEVLIYFSDTQIKVGQVYKWCKENKVKFIPYVGVIESHSESAVKRLVMTFYAKKNLGIYRHSKVLAKTPEMLQKLKAAGCTDATLFPVGLDESVMYHGDALFEKQKEADNQGNIYNKLLFVGRMEEEKHPLEMVEIYDEFLRINPEAKLTMIGDGYMYEAVEEALKEVISKHSLDDSRIQLLRKVPYNEMYNYYINSDVSINLNRVEILGMSILEALYYECPVIAIDAPGPRFILNGQNGETFGKIVSNKEEILNSLTDRISIDTIKRAKEHISNDFLWTALAKELIEDI